MLSNLCLVFLTAKIATPARMTHTNTATTAERAITNDDVATVVEGVAIIGEEEDAFPIGVQLPDPGLDVAPPGHKEHEEEPSCEYVPELQKTHVVASPAPI